MDIDIGSMVFKPKTNVSPQTTWSATQNSNSNCDSEMDNEQAKSTIPGNDFHSVSTGLSRISPAVKINNNVFGNSNCRKKSKQENQLEIDEDNISQFYLSYGLLKFQPASKLGKFLYISQVLAVITIPCVVLLAQNLHMFLDLMKSNEEDVKRESSLNLHLKFANAVLEVQEEGRLLAQYFYREHNDGGDGTFLVDIEKQMKVTDEAFNDVKWLDTKVIRSDKKYMKSTLRFLIHLDYIRSDITKIVSKKDWNEGQSRIQRLFEKIDFYNDATETLIAALNLSCCRSTSWRYIIIYFRIIKIIHCLSSNLTYALKHIALSANDSTMKPIEENTLIMILKGDALISDHYKQVMKILRFDDSTTSKYFIDTFQSKSYDIFKEMIQSMLNEKPTPSNESNIESSIKIWNAVQTLCANMYITNDILIEKINDTKISRSKSIFYSNIWNMIVILLAIFCVAATPVMTNNAATSMSRFVEKHNEKYRKMKKKCSKRSQLIHRMLPPTIIERIHNQYDEEVRKLQQCQQDEADGNNEIIDNPDHLLIDTSIKRTIIADTFVSVSILFTSVNDFKLITKKCSALQVINFLNKMYSCFDERMEMFDVYKVESISDSYLVVSGLPIPNEDKHITEICSVALNLKNLCRNIIVPTTRSPASLQAGIHTGSVVAGVVGMKMPRYCVFGDAINTASRMQSTSEPNKIQLSEESKILLEVKGGFEIEHRGEIEVKGKGMMNTYWLVNSVVLPSQTSSKLEDR